MTQLASHEEVMEIEEALQDFDCFYCYINPERKRPHPDSYGSCFDPKKVTQELIDKFPEWKWRTAILYWWGNPNCYMQWKVTALTFASKLKMMDLLEKHKINEWEYEMRG